MKEESRQKNPILALILSCLLPGLGQIYNGQFGKGIFFVAFNIVINLLLKNPLTKVVESPEAVDQATFVVFIGYLTAGIVLWIYAMVDAKRFAEKINREESVV